MGNFALNPTSWMKAGLPCRMAFSPIANSWRRAWGNWAGLVTRSERAIFRNFSVTSKR